MTTGLAVKLTLTEGMTVADALVAYALQPDSTDQRIRDVIAALRALDYPDTADTLASMQNWPR